MKWAFFLLLSMTASAAPKTLTIYTYDSLVSGSFGEWLTGHWRNKTGGILSWVTFGSSGEALNQIAIESTRTKADLILGIDQAQLERASELKLFAKVSPNLSRKISAELRIDPENRFIPFDYGYLAILYHSDAKNDPPHSLQEICKGNKKLVIQDPRTSSIGLSFLLWTLDYFGEENFKTAWVQLNRCLLTVSPSWSASYGLFLSRNADYVVSYTTSAAYHIEKENREDIKPMIFQHGHYRQIEMAAVLTTSSQKPLAEEWLSFLLSPEVQKEISLRQWMYPVLSEVALPESFKKLPKVGPQRSRYSPNKEMRKKLIQRWTEALRSKKQ